MKYLYFILLFAACHVAEKDKDVNLPITEFESLLNSYENFGKKSKKNNPNQDSILNQVILNGNLNSDLILDSVILVSNRNTNKSKLLFSCFPPMFLANYTEHVLIYDAGDLNSDGNNEIVVLDEGENSCWDQLKLYSIYKDKWIEKYSGTTYQCIDKKSYSLQKLNSKQTILVTYGNASDSIDQQSGDTIFNVKLNDAQNHVIKW